MHFEIRNPKSEIRNKSEISNLGFQLPNLPGKLACLIVIFSACMLHGQSTDTTASPNRTQAQPSANPAARAKDSIIFRTGDLLYGSLQSIRPNQAVYWRHPDASENIEFMAGAVSEIQLGRQPLPLANLLSNCRVHLTNQDELEGALRLCDSERVILESWYGSTIEIPRNRVQYLMPLAVDFPTIFTGPDGMDGWNSGQVSAAIPNSGEWKFKDKAFYATEAASIARDVKLPDIASICFDLTWKGMLSIAVALYTDYLEPINLQNKESEPDFGGFYSLRLNPYTADLLPVTKTDPIRYLGQTAIPGLSQKTHVEIDVRVNKPKRTVALMADGVLLKQWIDTEKFVGQGTGLRFVHQGQGAVKLSNIRISEWDGQFEERPSNPPDSKHDLAKLQNGDRVNGQLLRVEHGKMQFAPAEGSPLEVPVNRVKLIELAGRTLELPKNDGADVRATFRGGGSITFKLESWNDHQVIGTSSNFGKATFHPAAFERIQFLNAPPPGA